MIMLHTSIWLIISNYIYVAYFYEYMYNYKMKTVIYLCCFHVAFIYPIDVIVMDTLLVKIGDILMIPVKYLFVLYIYFLYSH